MQLEIDHIWPGCSSDQPNPDMYILNLKLTKYSRWKLSGHLCVIWGKTLIHGQQLDGFVHLGCFHEILYILDFFVQKTKCLHFQNAFWTF